MGMDNINFYANFGQQVVDLKISLMGMINNLVKEGKTVAAYGAAAKGATMLNVMGIDNALVPYVVDKNTYKQGRHMPGTCLLYTSPSPRDS